MSNLSPNQKTINLDTASATPVDPRVFKKMLPYFSQEYGNPSSIHQLGVKAAAAKEEARQKIAAILGAQADEIVFTSGGTEGDNLALLGVAQALLLQKIIKQPGHILTTTIEHSAVLESCQTLAKNGWKVSYAPVEGSGLVDLTQFKKLLRPETAIVSVMYANNEIGTIEPLAEIRKILRGHREKNRKNLLPFFHTDACQAPRFLPLKVEKLGVDLLTINSSKIYGPKGIGALYVRRGTPLRPLLFGGGQERGRRSGTENVAAIVGLAEALSLCNPTKETARLLPRRDYFIKQLQKTIAAVKINGDLDRRLPNNINVTLLDVSAELAVIELDRRGILSSTGSACSSNNRGESHVIMSLGHDENYAGSTIRFSLGRDIVKKDIDYTIRALKEITTKGRSIKI